MRTIFKQEIEQLGNDLIAMAEHTSTAISAAATALEQADLELAQRVIDADRRIDESQRSVDEQAVSLLARQAPVASDLRVVVTALRLSSTIERMGDLARHVADVARGRYPETALSGRSHDVVLKMAQQAAKVAEQVVRLLEDNDLDLAASIESDDEIIDAMHRQTFELVLDENESLSRQEVVDLVLLGRYLERFGDHGVSVARRISYLVTGDLTNAVVEVPEV